MSQSTVNEPVKCHSCGTLLDLPPGPVARTEECDSCRSDVRVCLNCSFYDVQSYNECREPMADRVIDKDSRNFCEYFSLGNSGRANSAEDAKTKALKALDDLFKK